MKCERCEQERMLREVYGLRPAWPLVPHEHKGGRYDLEGALPWFADPEE